MKLGLLTSIREDNPLPYESMFKRVMTNLAPMYLAAFLEKRRVPVEIYIKDRFEDLIPHCPEILGISSVTENIEFAKQIAKQAKALCNPITILGGAHLTALPKALPQEFDIGVIGEGEETLCDVVQHVQEYKGLEISMLKNIPGLSFHTLKGVHQTPFRKGVDPLDEIPHPAREKFIKKTGITYMMTSRGCPYTCSFCTIPNISEGYRKHSPRYVVEEILSIKKHFSHIRHIRIFDDLYIVDRKRVAEIAELVAQEGLHQDLSFGCWGRANLIDEKTVKVFHKMNMCDVAFGAESGSTRVMSKIKPGSSVEDNQRAIDLLHDNGIRVTCSFLLGHPLETEDDLWATYEFIEKNFDKLSDIEFNVAIPWPGTELWQQARQRGIVEEGMDFSVLKEACGLFSYSTETHPYLNEKVLPGRFDDILVEFKKLNSKMLKKAEKTEFFQEINPEGGIAELI